jgi:hypothetical protein
LDHIRCLVFVPCSDLALVRGLDSVFLFFSCLPFTAFPQDLHYQEEARQEATPEQAYSTLDPHED